MVYNPSQQLSVVSQPSGVHPQPNQQQVVAYPPPREVKLSLASNRSWRTPLGESKPSQQQLGVQLQLSQQQFVAYSPFQLLYVINTPSQQLFVVCNPF